MISCSHESMALIARHQTSRLNPVTPALAASVTRARSVSAPTPPTRSRLATMRERSEKRCVPTWRARSSAASGACMASTTSRSSTGSTPTTPNCPPPSGLSPCQRRWRWTSRSASLAQKRQDYVVTIVDRETRCVVAWAVCEARHRG
jgi:hypothetical protein